MLQETFRKWVPGTYNEKNRTVDAVVATGNPVMVYDFLDFDGNIKEVLDMDGCAMPESGQIPLLDTHDRSSVRNILGSCRDLRIENSRLIGTLYFSDDGAGKNAEVKVRDGHLTDLSLGAAILKHYNLASGETASVNGSEIEGPARVVTEWRPFEASAVPVGADSQSIIRSMDMLKNQGSNGQGNPGNNQNQDPQQNPEEVLRAERERVNEIYSICSCAGLDEFARQFIADGVDVETARKKVIDHMQRTNPPIGPGRFLSMGETGDVKRSEAITDGLLMRTGFTPEKTAPGADEFRHFSVLDIARDCLQRNSRENVTALSPSQTIRRAMTLRTHSSDDFPEILANTGNKMLRQAYENTPSTFEEWTVKGQGRDFKEMKRVQLSEAPDLKHIPENAEYEHGTFGESSEVFQILKFGRMFSISWEALINDDLGAFERVARAFIASAKRGLNANVYQKLIDNAAMSDGISLFHADHNNLASGEDAGVISIDTLGKARRAMRTQKGLQTDYPLNIEPRVLIVPAALETTADQVVNTQVGLEADSGAGARNPFYQKLRVVPEPILDGTSESQWYLTADPRFFDTIEVAYLDGNETPYLEEEAGFAVDAWRFKIRFCYGIGVLDYRGLYRNNG
ncbi:MAG: prohead protease/major capsid protein fusion protein [Desulfobacterales bacterium]